MSTWPKCKFAIRYPAGGGKWRFVTATVEAPTGYAPFVPIEHPPVVGDLVVLHDSREGPLDGGPVFRVIDRMWVYPAYGSPSWPYRSFGPTGGPLLEIVAEPARGLYADETPHCDHGECEAVLVNGLWQLPAGLAMTYGHHHHARADES